jgi:hypothetical protein
MTETIITPARLNDLWDADKHAVAWLLHDLTEEQRDALAVDYWHWLDRGDIRLTEVQNSFEAAMWLTEPDHPEYKPRTNVMTPDPDLTIYDPDYDTLEAAFNQAASKPMDARWKRALDGAYAALLELDGVAVEYGSNGGIAVAYIPSATEPGITYRVNGECQCKAHEHERPCWHRAAKRLLNIAHEQQAARRVVSLPALRRMPAAEVLNADTVNARAYAASGIGDLFPD